MSGFFNIFRLCDDIMQWVSTFFVRCLYETSVNITKNIFPLGKREKSTWYAAVMSALIQERVLIKKYAHFFLPISITCFERNS